MARKKRVNSIRREIEALLKRNIDPIYLEQRIGKIVDADACDNVSVCRAIAMAQVKKGLEGDLRAAEFIEDILAGEEEAEEPKFELVLKVEGPSGAKNGA